MTAPQTWLADHLGPVEILAIALPATAAPAPWQSLLAAVDAHLVRVLDLEFIHRTGDDEAEVVAADDLPDLGLELPELAGSSSGLLTDADILELLPELAQDEIAAVLVVEHLGLLDTVHAFEAAGARVLAEGTVGFDDLAQALDDTEED